MTTPGSARAPKGAAGGEGRPSPRPQGERGPAWVRPYKRAQRALDSAASLISSSFHAVVHAASNGDQNPIHAVKRLTGSLRELTVASLRENDARRDLAEACVALRGEPEQAAEALELLDQAIARCEAVAKYIPLMMQEVLEAQIDIVGGLSTGELVPERMSDGRRRIPVTPHPLFVRAFLASRQPRVSDRITPVLARRRRTLRPAEVRVPRRNLCGRAPPLSSTCAI